MQQVQVSIGRNNASGISLPKIAWYNFQSAISDTLWFHTRGGDRGVEIHKGEGQWEDQTEESAHITMLDVFSVDREALSRDLARIALRYGQTAIALTVTEPELITAGRGWH